MKTNTLNTLELQEINPLLYCNLIAEVQAKRIFFDKSLNRQIERGEVLHVSIDRLKLLINANVIDLICLKN